MENGLVFFAGDRKYMRKNFFFLGKASKNGMRKKEVDLNVFGVVLK